MSILTDLGSAYQEMLADDQDWNVARVVLHDLLTDDTIRALLDVAEAAQELCYGGTFSPRLQAAIAPLVKEASDE